MVTDGGLDGDSNMIELMKKLEGMKVLAYDCTSGKRTVGIGFNMEDVNARQTWDKLKIPENFDAIFNQELYLSEASAIKLFDKTWKWCVKTARRRCLDLNVTYGSMPEYKKFILADIAYNTGSVSKWRKVFLSKEPNIVVFEARRNPKEIMDSRVAKIAKFYGVIKTLDEAKKLGLEFAKYVD